jgi:ATP-dependent exoDNAse (exonuclease V) beta subunit
VKIKFDEKSHTYTHIDTEKPFISVTTLLGKYKQPFDRDGHSKRVADREGVSQELVLEMWEQEKNRACTRGTNIHKVLEDYINYGEAEGDWGWLCKSYDKAVERSIDSFKNVLCENLLYDEEYSVAGTADLIYEHKHEFTIGDFKTNKRFRFSSPYSERLKDPVSHLHNCEFNLYGLQLSLYAYLYEKMSGKRCRKCVIFYLQDDRFLSYHINYMKVEVEALLQHQLNSR